ncbi:glycosyltransferase family 2 protein [Chitinimonas arctica]|uniref:Glycosyltransferase family 2 protein n=1 Tax=Chitinimonas arctica TaxID=2594795 RepID=A0A516SEM6_9NEIS|nr:glycosyltransferase family 2 protein [Chitinimonas arctica]QDQ26612.1 glycosyltransferase family 2 protein [Chitinimonas arctica]
MIRVGLLVPTLNAGPAWPAWLAALAGQTRQPDRVLVIDSSSSDQTFALAQQAGLEVRRIERTQFDHGATRQWGVEILADCELIVCLTQDALLDTPEALRVLLTAFDDPAVGAAFGRQLPHLDANPIAAHARHFNYPPRSRVLSLEDRARFGLKTAFCSNSFAAWRRSALMACGGFPAHTLLAEDMLACARMLLSNWRVAYVAEANARHSHNYGFAAEFRRYFDTGALHAFEPWLLREFGRVEGEGMNYVRSEWAALQSAGMAWRLKAVLANTAKFTGYKAGKYGRHLPRSLCRRLSLHPAWWR